MNPDNVYQRLHEDLQSARKSKDPIKVEALKSLMSRIDNASAVDSSGIPASSSKIAGATIGLGSSEVPRRELIEADINHIIMEELDELQTALKVLPQDTAQHYRANLEAKLAIIQPYLNH